MDNGNDMSNRGDTGTPKAPVEPEPKPPAPTAETEPPKTPDSKAPCCCDHITLYLEMVHVITPTDAPGPPPISKLFGLIDDEVLVKCTSCDGSIEIWPHEHKSLDCPKCKNITPHAPLATIKPNPANCWVSCHVRIQVLKATKFDKILELLNAVFADLAKAYAAYNAAKLAGAAAGVLNTLTGQIDDLKKQVTDLEVLLVGADDSLMGEFFVNFEGSLACEAKLKDAIELPHDVTEILSNEVAIRQNFPALGGEWEIELRAIRSCPRSK